jgi:hypothetical protein
MVQKIEDLYVFENQLKELRKVVSEEGKKRVDELLQELSERINKILHTYIL